MQLIKTKNTQKKRSNLSTKQYGKHSCCLNLGGGLQDLILLMKLLTRLMNLGLGFLLKTTQLLQSHYYKLNLEQQWKITPAFLMHLPPPSIVAGHFNKAFRMLVSAMTITDDDTLQLLELPQSLCLLETLSSEPMGCITIPSIL